MIDTTVRQLCQLLGPPAHPPEDGHNVYIYGWEVNPTLDVVVQNDSPKDRSYALVWLPWRESASELPPDAELYPRGESRHSGLGKYRTLKPAMPAIKLWVRGPKALNEVVKMIQRRM